VEQQRFPRDKVCGECVSELGVEVLRRLGAADCLSRVGPAVLERVVIYAADGASMEMELPREMWGISRRVMDQLLLEMAREAGAVVFQPVRCEGIGEDIRFHNLEDNSHGAIRAKYVLLADGKAALMPGKATATGDFGVKGHFCDVGGKRDAIELFGLEGHYAGLAPIENGMWNLAMSVPGKMLGRFGGDLDGVFEAVLRASGPLAERLGGARRAGKWLSSPLPRFGVRRRWPKKVIPLGNAAAALEPIGGEGMGLAMRSAELAAEEVRQALSRGREVNMRELRREFDGLWRVRRMACRAVAMGVSRPKIAKMGVRAAEGCQSITKQVYLMMKGSGF